MKVIFIKDLKKQGRVNEIKEVSDGYAINYSVKYTKTSSEILNKDIKKKEEIEETAIREAIKLKDILAGVTLEFGVSANKGKIFGSVSSKQISEELKKKGFEIDKKLIVTDGALSSLGVHVVGINLHKKVKAVVNVKLIEK